MKAVYRSTATAAMSSSSLALLPIEPSVPEVDIISDDRDEGQSDLYRHDTIRPILTSLSSPYQRNSPMARTSSQRRISLELSFAANNHSNTNLALHHHTKGALRSPQLSEDYRPPMVSTPTRQIPSNRRQNSRSSQTVVASSSSATLASNTDYFSPDVGSLDSLKVPFPSTISLQSVQHPFDSPSGRRIARHVSLSGAAGPNSSVESLRLGLGMPPVGAVGSTSTPARPDYRHMRYSTDLHVNRRSQLGMATHSDNSMEDRTGSRLYSDNGSVYTNTLGSYTNEEGSGLSSAMRMARELSQSVSGPSKHKLIVVEDGKPNVTYQMGNCIGRGQFGSVYRALNLNTGQMVAVKRIKLEGLSEEEVTQLMGEVDLLKSLSHPSVVKYEGLVRGTEVVSIILEFVENGSLSHTLKAFGNFPEKLVASYVVKILEGLNYLHDMNVVHCDLKAANILTTKNGNVKLSDFGVSLNLKAVKNIKNDAVGTPNWMAPEVIELKGISTAADIWSLGCTIIELLTGKPPYGDMLAMSALWRIVEDDCPPFPDKISDSLRDFLTLCFQKDPTKRPSAEQLFEHEWLRKTWTGHKELRLQDSVPFLRRISADARRMDARALHKAIQSQQVEEESQLMERSSSSPPASLSIRPHLVAMRATSAPDPSWANLQQPLLAESVLSLSSEQASPLTPTAMPMTSSPPLMSLVDLSMRRSSDPTVHFDMIALSTSPSQANKEANAIPLIEPAFLDLSSSETYQIEEGLHSRPHAFVKITFSKAVLCKICRDPVKKHAVLCEECGLICHASCTKKAISACNLRTQLLMYANQGISSRSSMDLARTASPTPLQMNRATSPALSSDKGTPPLSPRGFKLPFVRLKRNSSSAQTSKRATSSSPQASSSSAAFDVPIAMDHAGVRTVDLLQSSVTPTLGNSPAKIQASTPSTPLAAVILSNSEASTPSSPQRRRRISLLPYLSRHRSSSPTPLSAVPMSLSRSMGSASRDNSLRYGSSISSAASSALADISMSKTNSSISNQLSMSTPGTTAPSSSRKTALHRHSIAATSSPQLYSEPLQTQAEVEADRKTKRRQSAVPQGVTTRVEVAASTPTQTSRATQLDLRSRQTAGSPPITMQSKRTRRLSSKQDCIVM